MMSRWKRYVAAGERRQHTIEFPKPVQRLLLQAFRNGRLGGNLELLGLFLLGEQKVEQQTRYKRRCDREDTVSPPPARHIQQPIGNRWTREARRQERQSRQPKIELTADECRHIRDDNGSHIVGTGVADGLEHALSPK